MDIGIEKGNIKPIKKEHKLFWRFAILILFVFLIIILIVCRVQFKYSRNIVDSQTLVAPNIAMIIANGEASDPIGKKLFENKILEAINLYQDGKIGRLIISGNANDFDYAKSFGAIQGLPVETIMPDESSGILESCQHAESVFGLSKIVIISQKYNLRRTLFICNNAKVNAVGVVADNINSNAQMNVDFSEMKESLKGWFKSF